MTIIREQLNATAARAKGRAEKVVGKQTMRELVETADEVLVELGRAAQRRQRNRRVRRVLKTAAKAAAVAGAGTAAVLAARAAVRRVKGGQE